MAGGPTDMTISNPWSPKDRNGEKLHAHGGQILYENGYYYWIGENRTGRNRVSVYKSRDFLVWEKRGGLTLDAVTDRLTFPNRDVRLEIALPGNKNPAGCNIERPKVVYCGKTGKYVMWMHWERPADYSQARCAVAFSDRIDGDYVYSGSFSPGGVMSRDCTLFQDDDGECYFISATNNNKDLNIYRLTDDYLDIEEFVGTVYPGQCREAPVVFKRNGRYYMITSGCTGWTPNQGGYGTSDDIAGNWSHLENFGDVTTYGSQPTWVFYSGDEWYYLGDRWGGAGENYHDSSYTVYTIDFNDEGSMCLKFQDELELNIR